MGSDFKLLDNYVDDQISNLKTVDTKHLEGMFENFSPEAIVEGSSMTPAELIESFRLSMITESLTEEYSKTFNLGASQYQSDWLGRYVSEFWEPDEMGHADPFKNILQDFGVDRSVINSEIADARSETDYFLHHSSGLHPISLTTYGIIQECITDYWYELQRGFFPDESNTSKILGYVKGREALHTVQFRDLTAMQIELDPYLMEQVLFAAVNFQMPANHIPTVKDIESKTQSLIPKMNGSVYELLIRVTQNIHESLNDKPLLGKTILGHASRSEKKFFGLIPQSTLVVCMSNLRGGYGLVGELLLDQLGLTGNEPDIHRTPLEKIQYHLKQPVKRWIRYKLELDGFFS